MASVRLLRNEVVTESSNTVAVTRSGACLVLVAAVSLVVVATCVLFFVYGNGQNGSVVVLTGLWAVLGAVIVALRPGNAVGWLFLALGLVWSVGLAATQSVESMSSQFLVTWASWLSEWFWILGFTLIVTSLFLIPTGRLPSRRRLPPLVVFEAAAVSCIVVASLEGTVQASSTAPLVTNPIGIAGLPDIESFFDPGLALIFFGGAVIGAASLVARYRSADTVERQQLKLVALGAPVAVLLVVIGGILGTSHPFLHSVIWDMGMSLIPVSVTIAILRYRLFDIDVIISRALLFALLSAGVTAVYAAIVLGIGTFVGHRSDPLLTIAAAVVIALLFQPLRQRASRLANRLVYGERATPYQVLSDFAADMAGQLDLGDALDRMVSLLGGASGASRVEAWIRVGTELRPGAVWPDGSAPSAAVRLNGIAELPVPDPAARMVPVRHGDDLLGAISLSKPPSEPLSSTEDSLLQHLASQAGLVMRNGQLTAELRATIDELRASRRRLVEAQDAERRKIERNLHDGAQQQLVALAIQLGLLTDSADDPNLIRKAIPDLKAQLSAALSDLRALAHGIYPPLLAEQGLVMALRSQTARSPVPVQVEADQVGRYPQDAESTVYFCTLEALQNVAKHARASQAAVRLSGSGQGLKFSISDDGAGFAATGMPHGSGLQGMSDRLAAHGGTLDVRSAPGRGTTIIGWLPAPVRATAPEPAAAPETAAAGPRLAGRG